MIQNPYVRPLTPDDVAYLAPLLREEDKEEIRAASGLEPIDALAYGLVAGAPALTLVAPDGEPCGACGANPQAPDVGYVWMVATPALLDHSRVFLRQCRSVIRDMNNIYPVLYSFMDARNEVHRKWVEWCGFTIIATHERMGVEQLPFYEIVRINHV